MCKVVTFKTDFIKKKYFLFKGKQDKRVKPDSKVINVTDCLTDRLTDSLSHALTSQVTFRFH